MSDVSELFEDLFVGADGIVLFSPSSSYYQAFAEMEDTDVIVAGRENEHGADSFVELPLVFDDIAEQLTFAIEGALDDDLVEEGDELLCGAKLFDEDEVDTVARVRASEGENSGVYDLFTQSRAEPSVIRSVFEVAIELGQKGQKGKPVGALFVVGDAGKVMNKSRPLSYNPFEKSHVHVGDPIVTVMLKEFSRLDGAFVISDSGKIVSAYRYLEPAAEGVDIPKGLGARHMAAGAITRDTNATAIVLSESDGLVRAFKGGELILEIDPENY
ncbi:diadenylate cyclase DacZ [Natronoarchaeum sp. GCM10025703]|uniref:diadenylate cyclase DacZ n=1 Tax=unclassified Natronoarchaeum TaxID=2620183 RepID=UPI003615994B